MIAPTPDFEFNVDLENPGQFFACCGLFELASCLDTGALGWFDGESFKLRMTGAERLHQLSAEHIQQVEDMGLEGSDLPVLIGDPFNLVLDWWTYGDTRFKTWAGGQSAFGFIKKVLSLNLSQGVEREIFKHLRQISEPKPFYFDSRLRRYTCLDSGFSTEQLCPNFSPLLEIFAIIGLQRFCPRAVDDRGRARCYCYVVWSEPLPVMVAAVVSHGLICAETTKEYVFEVMARSGGKYKSFGVARPKDVW